MFLAGIANENGPLLYWMALRTICGAHIDAVLVVEAPTDRVSFDDEVAHLEGAGWRTRWCRIESPMARVRGGRGEVDMEINKICLTGCNDAMKWNKEQTETKQSKENLRRA